MKKYAVKVDGSIKLMTSKEIRELLKNPGHEILTRIGNDMPTKLHNEISNYTKNNK